MAIETTSVPIVADRRYTHKLRILAVSKNKRIGDIVREAIDAHFGDQLNRIDVQLADEESRNATTTNTPR